MAKDTSAPIDQPCDENLINSFLELEENHRKLMKQLLTDKYVTESFPEAKEILPKKIAAIQNKINRLEKRISKLINFINGLKTDKFTNWFLKEFVKVFFIPELRQYDRLLFRQKSQLALLTPSKRNEYISNFQFKVEVARRAPIIEVASQRLELIRTGNNYKALCHFHDDTRPSLIFFPTTNTYKCFVCGQGGDVISFVMAIDNLSFTEAVLLLSK